MILRQQINVDGKPNYGVEWISRQLTKAFPGDHAPRYLIRDRVTQSEKIAHTWGFLSLIRWRDRTVGRCQEEWRSKRDSNWRYSWSFRSSPIHPPNGPWEIFSSNCGEIPRMSVSLDRASDGQRTKPANVGLECMCLSKKIQPDVICGLAGWGGRDRTSEWRNQNPLPYHLATPQRSQGTIAPLVPAGIAAIARTIAAPNAPGNARRALIRRPPPLD